MAAEKTGAISQSRRVINAARAKAQQILESAIVRARKARKEAVAEGFAHGMAKAAKLIHSLEREKSEIAEQQIVEAAQLAAAIAREVIGEELQANPESILTRIKRASAYTKTSRHIRITVHPDILPLVRSCLPAVEAEFMSKSEVSISASNYISKYSAVLETPEGRVVSDPDLHLSGIEEQLDRLTCRPNQ